jgi:hypothetical protein
MARVKIKKILVVARERISRMPVMSLETIITIVIRTN